MLLMRVMADDGVRRTKKSVYPVFIDLQKYMITQIRMEGGKY